jgi:hypothetical protein
MVLHSMWVSAGACGTIPTVPEVGVVAIVGRCTHADYLSCACNLLSFSFFLPTLYMTTVINNTTNLKQDVGSQAFGQLLNQVMRCV